MKRVMILTDSCGLPRNSPGDDRTTFEDTYHYKLTHEFRDVDFYQLQQSGATAPDLVSQAVAYFDHWDPDIILVQVGIVDCRPEPLPNFLRVFLTETAWLHRIKAWVYKPNVMPWLIKLKATNRVSNATYQKNIRRLREVFPRAEILWLEIVTSPSGAYDQRRPGVNRRIAEFNAATQNTLGAGFVPVQAAVSAVNGVHSDHLHLNRRGHQAVYEILRPRFAEILRR